MGATHDPQLLKGVLSPLLLWLLAERESYGYELVQRLRAAGLSGISEGTVYPALSRLEREGRISSRLVASRSGTATRPGSSRMASLRLPKPNGSVTGCPEFAVSTATSAPSSNNDSSPDYRPAGSRTAPRSAVTTLETRKCSPGERDNRGTEVVTPGERSMLPKCSHRNDRRSRKPVTG
ncbi:PadR family transcriptional regulator [Krasilnikovia sp. M28-CT-15]|uniref:PadR family transcriptional regulator n=1 Tax=Krasilnikovia sp. M28-CT-15 TaxID=3373540 RepID=UPI00399C995D